MLFNPPAVNATAQKAAKIDLFTFKTPQMRAFHMTWIAFFVCFFAWFAPAPLMPILRQQFSLSKEQIANLNIGSVALTIIARMIIGPLCDKYGPRRTYTWLLLIGAIPVFGLAFAQTYTALFVFRLLIGAIGASFVITQYHTSVMFAPNVVGTANATVGGWGNAGGGVTQTVMPILATALATWGLGVALGWRVALFVPGIGMVIMAFLYARKTQDTPKGDVVDLRERGISVDSGKKGGLAIFARAAANYRVWMLAATYAAGFGVEIFMHNIAASYYVDHFKLSVASAGLAAGIFGIIALFGRALGGIASDKAARAKGLDARRWLLFGLMLGEGAGLLFFSRAESLWIAIIAMTIFGLFTHMACGAIYALMPFIDRKALGGVAGLIGAGGNIGAVLAGFLDRSSKGPQDSLWTIGWIVAATSICAAVVVFPESHKKAERELLEQSTLAQAAAVH